MESSSSRYPADERGRGLTPGRVCILIILSAAAAAAAAVLVLWSGITGWRITDAHDEYDAELISTLAKQIKEYYYFDGEAPDSRELIEAAAHRLVEAVGDPYAAYYTNEEYTAFRSELNGNYKGIGVLVSAVEGRGLLVNRSYDGNPAYEAGIRDGDYIVAVDGTSLIGGNTESAGDLLLGDDGSVAELTVMRGEKELHFSVTRGDVYVRRVYSRLLDNNIGYIMIESFTGNAAEEFDAELASLTEKGIAGLIIDIRNNPGGSLDVVVDICDRVLPECTITTIEGKLVDPPKVYSSTDDERLDIPCAVLTNGSSASASEIFASALQDNGCGTVIGTVTFGKGIVQTSWDLGGGMGYIKLTTDVYRTPNGRLIHGIGVSPDIAVEQNEQIDGVDPYYIMRDYMDMDAQLAAAVDFLEGR